jgi:DNA-binding HxlR family transcriptional regulator
MSRNTPKPGQPVRGSRSGRPIMALLDLLGRRWALRILWELRHGPLNFRELRAACGDMSPSVLNLRLQELREAGIVTAQEGDGYVLSESGRKLFAAVAPLQAWADTWQPASGQRPRD